MIAWLKETLMRGWRPILGDWRFWAFAGCLVIVAVADMLVPPDVLMMTFLVVPVMGSAVLGSPRASAALTAIALAFGWLSVIGNGYVAGEAWRRMLVIAVVGVLAVVLARVVERAWAKSDELTRSFRLLAENATDIVFRTSLDGTIEWTGGNVENIVGWPADHFVGQHGPDLVHPDDRDAVTAVYIRALAGTPETFRARMLTKSGAGRWVEMSVHSFTEHGETTGFVGGWRDVDAEERTQAALSDSEARYRLLAENASDIVYSEGGDRHVTWISPAVGDALGWSPDELIGTLMADLVHPDDRAATEDAWLRASSGQPIELPEGGLVLRMRAKDGRYRWTSHKVTTQLDADGMPLGLVGGLTVVDDVIAARERAENEQARLQATLRSLLDPHVALRALRDEAGGIVDFEYADVNDAACDYMKLTRAELEGARLLDLLPGQSGSGMLALYAGAVETGIPLSLDDFAYPNEIHQAERRYDIRAIRVGDALSFTWRDVTDRHDSAQRITESEERYRLLAENSTDVVLLTRDGVLQWASPSLTTALNWRPADWIGRKLDDFIHPEDVALSERRREEVTAGAVRVTTLRMRGKDGLHHWVEVHAGPFTDSEGQPAGIVASFRVIDVEVAAQEELERRARYDDLTGVLNREEALSRLRKISRHVRRGGHESAILFCDIDRFKDINDQFGHSAGDEVLRVFARRIETSVRSGDTVARMGGDEFLVVLDGIHHLDEAGAIAEKIRTLASAPIEVPDGIVRATLSIGVTLSSPDENAHSMVERADQAMYDAKDAGRNRVITIQAPEVPMQPIATPVS